MTLRVNRHDMSYGLSYGAGRVIALGACWSLRSSQVKTTIEVSGGCGLPSGVSPTFFAFVHPTGGEDRQDHR